jgi:hypothetical protein
MAPCEVVEGLFGPAMCQFAVYEMWAQEFKAAENSAW